MIENWTTTKNILNLLILCTYVQRLKITTTKSYHPPFFLHLNPLFSYGLDNPESPDAINSDID